MLTRPLQKFARAAIVSAVALLEACGSGGGQRSIDATKYSHACVGDSDCIAVYQGALSCCGGGCPNAVIAASAYDAYASALAATIPMCNPQPPCADPTASCPPTSALCVGGLCTLAMTSTGALSATSAPAR